MYGTSLFWSDKHVGSGAAVFPFNRMTACWYYSGNFTAYRHNSEGCLKEVKKFSEESNTSLHGVPRTVPDPTLSHNLEMCLLHESLYSLTTDTSPPSQNVMYSISAVLCPLGVVCFFHFRFYFLSFCIPSFCFFVTTFSHKQC